MKVWESQGYQFGLDSPQGLRCRKPSSADLFFPYNNSLRLKVSPWTGELRLRSGRQKISLSPLSGEQLRDFLPAFFTAWKEADSESAAKAAFDYVDAQKGFVPIAFTACLLVSLPVAVALLADSHQQFYCTRELRDHAVPGQIEVVKAKKKDSRTFILNLEFKAPNGQVVRGKEEVLLEKNQDPPKMFPIFYSPAQPDCWALTKSLDNQEINWAKRRYFASFTLLFGLFFLATTMLGLAWSVARWWIPRPFASEVKQIFGF